VDSALSKRTGLLDASVYALVVADLIAIAAWTRDFVVNSEDAIFESTRNYFAFGGPSFCWAAWVLRSSSEQASAIGVV
jgi:hypothetical protein